METAKNKAVEHYAAALALEAGNFKEDAIIQLQEAIRLDSEMALAHSKMGELYQQRGQYQRAATAYENACRLDPWAFSDHLNLGKVYRKLQKFQRAIEILRRACQLNPQHPDANYNLGVCYYETENYDLAAAFCSRAAELDPENEQYLAGLGEIYSKQNDNYGAIRVYKQALEINPQQYDVMIRLGMVYLHMERYGPAQFIFEKAIETAPTNPEPYLALGYCFLCQQQIEPAQANYHKALSYDSKSFAAYNGIGVTKMMRYLENPQANQKDAAAALECWYTSLEIKSEQPKIKQLIIKYRHLTEAQAVDNTALPSPPAEKTVLKLPEKADSSVPQDTIVTTRTETPALPEASSAAAAPNHNTAAAAAVLPDATVPSVTTVPAREESTSSLPIEQDAESTSVPKK